MEITYRKARREDARRLAEIERICFGGEAAYADSCISAKEFKTLIATNNNLIFVGDSNGRIAGYVYLEVEEQAYDFIKVCLASIATDPPFRRSGIARDLMLLAETEALRAAGPRRLDMVAQIELGNLPSRRLFETFNYVSAGVLKGYYREDIDAVLMCKNPRHPGLNF